MTKIGHYESFRYIESPPLPQKQTWVVVSPRGLVWVGIAENERHAWQLSGGSLSSYERIKKFTDSGWYAARATVTWEKP